MTSSELPPRLGSLTFHGPLSEDRARRIVARLAAVSPATVLDIGCGWGELLLRVVESVPGATGVGLDINAEDLARGRHLAKERGLSERVEFAEESALGTSRGPVDAVLCLGSGQALCDPGQPYDAGVVLRELRRLVRPGGTCGSDRWPTSPSRRASDRPGSNRRAERSGRSSRRATAMTRSSGSRVTRTTPSPPRPANGSTASGRAGSTATATSSASRIRRSCRSAESEHCATGHRGARMTRQPSCTRVISTSRYLPKRRTAAAPAGKGYLTKSYLNGSARSHHGRMR